MKRRSFVAGIITAGTIAVVAIFHKPLRMLGVSSLNRRNWFTRDEVECLAAISVCLIPFDRLEMKVEAFINGFVEWLRDYDQSLDSIGASSRAVNREIYELNEDHRDPISRKELTRNQLVSNYRHDISKIVAFSGQANVKEFKNMSIEERTRLIEMYVNQIGLQEVPRYPSGKALIPDLLSYYVQQPDSWDLRCGARVSRRMCRGLTGVGLPPERIRI